MDIATWILAGAAVGWAGFNFMRFNQDRGLVAAVLLGAAGGFVGGSLLAPAFGYDLVPGGGFNVAALFLAVVTAAALLFAGDRIHRKFGV